MALQSSHLALTMDAVKRGIEAEECPAISLPSDPDVSAVMPSGTLPPAGSRVRARRLGWDAVQANNRLRDPDPSLPTYEGLSQWVEGALAVRHVHSDLAGIDYDKVTVEGADVEPASVEPVPPVNMVGPTAALRNGDSR